eukprot:gene15667-17905_t
MSGSHRKTGGTKLSNKVTGQTKKRKANDTVDATDQIQSHQPAPKLLKSDVTTSQITPPVLPPSVVSSATGLPCIPIIGYALTEEAFYHSGDKYHRLVLAELPIKQGGRRLDIGAGIRVSSDAEPPIYLLRKEFFSVRHQYQIEGMPPVIDHLTHDSVCIDGKEYVVVLHENPSYEYCLAVTNPVEFRASYKFRANVSSLVLEVDSLCAVWCVHTAPGQHCGYCHNSQSFDVALECFVGGGRPLWEGGCGGVWAGYFRDRNGHNVYDFSTTGNAEPVVVKRFLHVGRCAPPPVPHTTAAATTSVSASASAPAPASATPSSSAPPRSGPPRFSVMRSNLNRSVSYYVMRFPAEQAHKASQGIAITSADLAEGFAIKEKAGSKENPMREVELMAHIARVIPNHTHYFSTLRGFGVSATDVYVLTVELDTLSLYHIKDARGKAGIPLQFSEDVSKLIVKRLLQALRLLHVRRIAHWDIKIENTAFRIKPSGIHSVERGLLVDKLRARSPLTDADLSMLEAMLIDFGQAVWGLPQAVTTAAVALSTVSVDADTDAMEVTSDKLPTPPTTAQSRTSPRGVNTVGNVSPMSATTPVPWLREMTAGRSPPGSAHSMAPEHSDFLRDEREAQANRGPGHTGPALTARHFQPEKIDMWQVGVMLFGLLTDRALFTEATREKYFTDVRSEPHWQRVNIDQRMAMVGVTVTEECKDFLLQLLHVEPSGRMSVETALEHPWLQ